MSELQCMENLLRQVAESVKWKNLEIKIRDNEKGTGFLGEFFLATIINKDTDEKLELAIKRAFKTEQRRGEVNIPVAYENEIYFYEKIVPTLLKFKERKGVSISFDFIPKFYVSIKEKLNECLILENLQTLGFKIIERQNMFDQDQVNMVLQTYGKYHGLSFAFKDQQPDAYKKLMSSVTDFFVTKPNKEGFKKTMEAALVQSFACVDETIRNKYKQYLTDGAVKIFFNAWDYKGTHSTLIHGDCWSSNMMFKYQDSKLVDMKLVDYQLIKEGTPVFDISYFLYAGTTKNVFSNLDKYLEIYYDSFSKTVRTLGSDPHKLLPLDALKEDWKKYSKFGVMWGLFVNKVKLIANTEAEDMGNDQGFMDQLSQIKFEGKTKVLYEQRVKDIIEDVHEKGYLLDY